MEPRELMVALVERKFGFVKATATRDWPDEHRSVGVLLLVLLSFSVFHPELVCRNRSRCESGSLA
jgi:hypothetical protein